MIYKGVKDLLDVTISACSNNNWIPPPIIIKQDTKEKLNTYPPLFKAHGTASPVFMGFFMPLGDAMNC